jgi:hypothetical protein
MPTCQGRTKDGRPCIRPLRAGQTHCAFHREGYVFPTQQMMRKAAQPLGPTPEVKVGDEVVHASMGRGVVREIQEPWPRKPIIYVQWTQGHGTGKTTWTTPREVRLVTETETPS